MSRIPQNFIDDLLARVNIVDIIDGRVKLKKAGKNYSGLCPFHQEKSPSFSVSPDKQFYYCFGCGAGGNAIGFLMEYERLEFPQAVEELAKYAGVDVPRDEHSHQRSDEHKAQLSTLDAAAQYYQEQLRQHPNRNAAVNYLKARGLTGQVAQYFGIGYAPDGWDNLLKRLGTSPEQQQLLEQSGLLIRHEERDRLYDRFRHRIMFPIRDIRGRVIAFGGRVLGDEKPKYLNSPETDTFHKSRELYGLFEARRLTQKLDKIVIVEGYMDVISLAQFGITYAVATLGTATTAQHLERLFKTVSEVIFCFDGDAAGRKAAERALETTLPVIKDGQEARFLFLPEGEDPDSLVRKESQSGFETRLKESALPLSEFFFQHLQAQHDMTSIDGRASFSVQALPLLQQMPASLRQQMMMERISEITGLTTEQISRTVNLQHSQPHPTTETGSLAAQPSARAPSAVRTFPAPQHTAPLSRSTTSLCSHIISILLHHPELVKNINTPLSDINELPLSDIDLLTQLIHYFQNTPSAALGVLLIDWNDDPTLRAHLLKLSEISRLDPVLNGNPQQLFQDAWQKLMMEKNKLVVEKLRKRSLATLSEDEKNLLKLALSAEKTPR